MKLEALITAIFFTLVLGAVIPATAVNSSQRPHPHPYLSVQ